MATIDINILMPVAQVLKSYGTEGEMTVSLFTNLPEDIYLKEPVFIIYDGLPVPFFISSISAKGSTKALVRLEDIETLEEADALSGAQLLMPETLLEEEDEDEEYDEYTLACRMIGYTLFDQDKKEIGPISEAYDFSGNICIEVGKYTLPFRLDLILKVNKKKKYLYLRVPTGLIP